MHPPIERSVSRNITARVATGPWHSSHVLFAFKCARWLNFTKLGTS
jgi:hypothetical protein